MSLQLLDRPIASVRVSLERAILETLAYSDVFDYPLRAEEIHRYLPVQATLQEVHAALGSGLRSVDRARGYFFLEGREALVSTRRLRESVSQGALPTALRIGRLLSHLPFIRMVALTGSLAVLNSADSADLDYMLVTAHGRVWTARAFAILLGRFTGYLGRTLCPNLIVSERYLAWRDRNVYSAREICQMIPIAGATTYFELRRANAWTREFLPNASSMPPLAMPIEDRGQLLQSCLEWPLRGPRGDWPESWERNRKINRFTRLAGFGQETRFDADICQGNFNHYGAKTQDALRERLLQLGIHPSPVAGGQEGPG